MRLAYVTPFRNLSLFGSLAFAVYSSCDLILWLSWLWSLFLHLNFSPTTVIWFGTIIATCYLFSYKLVIFHFFKVLNITLRCSIPGVDCSGWSGRNREQRPQSSIYCRTSTIYICVRFQGWHLWSRAVRDYPTSLFLFTLNLLYCTLPVINGLDGFGGFPFQHSLILCSSCIDIRPHKNSMFDFAFGICYQCLRVLFKSTMRGGVARCPFPQLYTSSCDFVLLYIDLTTDILLRLGTFLTGVWSAGLNMKRGIRCWGCPASISIILSALNSGCSVTRYKIWHCWLKSNFCHCMWVSVGLIRMVHGVQE